MYSHFCHCLFTPNSHFVKAGLLMYTKELDKFVIENEAEILRMPHFHLGKYLLIFAFIALKAKKQTASENFMKGLLLQSLLTFTYYFQHLFFLVLEVEFQLSCLLVNI